MHLTYEDERRRMIEGREIVNFSSFSSFHLIVVSARVKSEKQISKRATDDEDLVVTLEKDKTFPSLTDPTRLKDTPAAFSGGKLHNLLKTVYFLTFLKGKDHTIVLKTDDDGPKTATSESLKVYTLNLDQTLKIKVEDKAEDGDRRPWITFALDNVLLKSFSPTITYSRRKRDSDDVKISVDEKVQRNLLKTIKHTFWKFAGSLLPNSSPIKTETDTITVDLPQDLHYIEFEADRMPMLQTIKLDFGSRPPSPSEVPNLDNPKWTGDFYDDTEEMLFARAIYGEAGGESEEAKAGVGWAIKNRVEDEKKRWGKTYHEVILQPVQYEPFNDPNLDRFKKITNPLLENLLEKSAWYDSYKAAENVVLGKIKDPVRGANHFYSTSLPSKPGWADEEKFVTQIGATRFYKL